MKLFEKTVMNCAFAGVVFSQLTLAAAPAYAADPNISSFAACATGKTNVVDAVACLPAGCVTTVTLSEESAQPACTLRDGTRLPRVIFSCPIPNTSLRFRPSFSLCTAGGIIKHIEVGEDVNRSTRTDDPEFRLYPFVQKMADISFTTAPATAALDTPSQNLGCAECHDRKGTIGAVPNVANLFLPFPPALADGTIYTNDPVVRASGEAPAVNTPLGGICTGIANSSTLARNPTLQNLAHALCLALAPLTP
jgi:hypothetical protein